MPRTVHLLLLSLLLTVTGVVAGKDATPIPRDPTADPVLVAGGFLDHHPDLRFRMQGLKEYGRQNHSEAFRLFQRAGYYSDKPSQAIVGEMLWIGLGAVKDRALAYVWMDLAAERGYASFAGKRDLYWRQLDDSQRARAMEQGEAIRAEYADAAAEPRLAAALRRGRGKMTGSRTGSITNPVQIFVPGYGSIEGSRFWDPQLWEPSQYRQWHDSFWMDLRIGTVNVGEVEQVGESALPVLDAEIPADPRATTDDDRE